MIKRWLLSYRFSILAFVTSLAFIVHYHSIYRQNLTYEIDKFQRRFLALEDNMDELLSHFQQTPYSSVKQWKSQLNNDEKLYIHVFRNDSLIYWNSNEVPISPFADIHFPSDGILHLQNGWYYSKTTKKGKLIYSVSFLIKHEFPYENTFLVNTFSDELKLPFNGTLSFDNHPDYSIYSSGGKHLFSLQPNINKSPSEHEVLLNIILLIASIILWLGRIYQLQKRFVGIRFWLTPIILLMCRLSLYFLPWNTLFPGNRFFDPSLYGVNSLFPTFFDFLVNIIFLNYLFQSILFLTEKRRKNKHSVQKLWLLLVLSILFFFLIVELTSGLVENSSIPLAIHRLFQLNTYSLLSVTSIGVSLFTYFQIKRFLLGEFRINNVKSTWFFSCLTGLIALVLGIEYSVSSNMEWYFAFPIIPALLLHLINRSKKPPHQLGFGLLFLTIFSIFITLLLSHYNQRKEAEERELYANQLSTEQDIVTEVEYAAVAPKIQEDQLLRRLIESPVNISYSDFEDGIERRLFGGYWERYDLNFFLFYPDGHSIIGGSEGQKDSFETLTEIVKEHGLQSEIDSSIFFIADNTSQLSYIIRQPIYADSIAKAYLFCTLKSKKIPEEIGFPRLLISSKSQVLENLTNFSVAKYHDDRLITRYGEFTFPSTVSPFYLSNGKNTSTISFDGYAHFVLKTSSSDIFVLSTKAYTWKEYVTSASYLFSYFGLLLLPFLLQFRTLSLFKRTINLSVKIQLMLIGLVFLSLLAFSWGSGIFVQKQYNAFSNALIQDKLESIEMELHSKIGSEKKLSIAEKGNFLEATLRRLSQVFVTDLNFYDPQGYLIATSRPRVFNSGLISEQMNPASMTAFKIGNKSSFSHEERIGKLNFVSSYLPFFSSEGKLLGYLNLQQFGQQQASEQQLQQFLISIIHIFMLLMAISIVVALFISHWLTSPLRMLQLNFAAVRFGQHNQRIQYEKEDEIGALVKNYNKKLEELDQAARQLSINERESAWRDMAKQVAHEIKNPLTPMKLSVQHLLRTYNPEDPGTKERIESVAKSLIEQIDALSRIANEFSNFAKMPPPIFIEMDLIPILRNVIDIYQKDTDSTIELLSVIDEMKIEGDRDQMVRTFNNLIKNAIQAIPDHKVGHISIRIENAESEFEINICDNGVGIPPDEQNRIFVPHFTTKSKGNGLGLAMVKQIIENHNGTIRFESELGKGTCFILHLPKKNRTT